jgi:hypothetical protein
MKTKALEKRFKEMGARLKVEASNPNHGRIGSGGFSLDVKKDRWGEYFEIKVSGDPDLYVSNIDARNRHLLMISRDFTDIGRRRNEKVVSRYLCGHDERSWFAATVPGAVSTVRGAMESLKPKIVRESQVNRKVKVGKWNKRKNEGFVRQGEWMFIPCEDMKVDEKLIFKNEALRRGKGTPHMAEFLYREGGTTVYVCRNYPNGVTEEEYKRLVKGNPNVAKFRWTTMRRDPEAYVKGKIRHPDHKTVVLKSWYRVAPNAELTDSLRSRVRVAFLD